MTDKKDDVMQDFTMLWMLMGAHRRAGMHRGDRGMALDPTRGRGRIVAMLQIKDGLSAKKIAQVLGIRVSSLNETLSKMEKDGVIERSPSEADKRVMLVYLTDEGKKISIDDDGDVDVLNGFDEEELDNMTGFLKRMIANAESGLDAETINDMKERWEARTEFMESFGCERPSGRRFPRGGGMGIPFAFHSRMEATPHCGSRAEMGNPFNARMGMML